MHAVVVNLFPVLLEPDVVAGMAVVDYESLTSEAIVGSGIEYVPYFPFGFTEGLLYLSTISSAVMPAQKKRFNVLSEYRISG
jgi:hypothetical protein